MKTTLEIADELMRRVKMRAVQRNQKLRDTVATLLEAGIVAVARLVTEDARLRQAAPALTMSLSEALAA
jgi:hypothetical protein